MSKLFLTLSALVPLLAGCASIVEGSSQTLAFDTNPQGAVCTLDRHGEKLGTVTTPGSITIKKTKYEIDVTCSKDGYQPTSAKLASDSSQSTVGNLILGGGIGWIVDSASGSDNKYNEHTSITLTKK